MYLNRVFKLVWNIFLQKLGLNMNINRDLSNKTTFRRIILTLVFLSILSQLIPTIFNFEKYYGLSRFINQGLLSIYLDNKLELYLTIFMSFFSFTSIILIYFFAFLSEAILLNCATLQSRLLTCGKFNISQLLMKNFNFLLIWIFQ